MEELKTILAKNISFLRQESGMTQLELAEKLHYSDKAVSKWERAESVPEISTLVAIAELFSVPLDYLVHEKHDKNDLPKKITDKRKNRNRAIITCTSIVLVWFVALFVYTVFDIASPDIMKHWLSFLYAVPVSMVVWLVFNSIWFSRRRNFLIISLLLWSTLAAIHLTFLTFGMNIWQIYLLGIPGQVVTWLWSGFRNK